ncbi:hypothetical protein Fmac_031449 [Flemingia macrophylla]|uniref:Auxin-induced protein n=1 Tax=Flemingia macrophylla TaxID=520843 RepID=A0ABD1L2K7_9FABA
MDELSKAWSQKRDLHSSKRRRTHHQNAKTTCQRPIESEPSEQSTAHDVLRNVANDHQKFLQTSQPISFTGYGRSCVKVYKKGLLFGMSVNLTQLSGYDELVHKLDQLFEFGGELISSPKNWLVVYNDDDEDIMVVGDDPWQEFVVCVRNIYIYPEEEIQKMRKDERLHEGSDNEMPNWEKEFLYMQLQDHRHAERLHKGSNSDMHYQENDNLHKQFRGKQKIGDSVSSWSLLTDSDTNVTLSNSHDYSGPS